MAAIAKPPSDINSLWDKKLKDDLHKFYKRVLKKLRMNAQKQKSEMKVSRFSTLMLISQSLDLR